MAVHPSGRAVREDLEVAEEGGNLNSEPGT